MTKTNKIRIDDKIIQINIPESMVASAVEKQQQHLATEIIRLLNITTKHYTRLHEHMRHNGILISDVIPDIIMSLVTLNQICIENITYDIRSFSEVSAKRKTVRKISRSVKQTWQNNDVLVYEGQRWIYQECRSSKICMCFFLFEKGEVIKERKMSPILIQDVSPLQQSEEELQQRKDYISQRQAAYAGDAAESFTHSYY